ncbi:hypothetical protein CEXT_253721 [Caerostris extrusa]|uniref:Uncharacterized protein n=1 Tax=Caerostris extrusa TaxID=172846 RepID=A0AAV4MF69_CAEEX|nr:hypothetical protein CEXT_253721 [Caerostris extrusa]
MDLPSCDNLKIWIRGKFNKHNIYGQPPLEHLALTSKSSLNEKGPKDGVVNVKRTLEFQALSLTFICRLVGSSKLGGMKKGERKKRLLKGLRTFEQWCDSLVESLCHLQNCT